MTIAKVIEGQSGDVVDDRMSVSEASIVVRGTVERIVIESVRPDFDNCSSSRRADLRRGGELAVRAGHRRREQIEVAGRSKTATVMPAQSTKQVPSGQLPAGGAKPEGRRSTQAVVA